MTKDTKINWPADIGLFNPYGSMPYQMRFESESGSRSIFAVDPQFHANGEYVIFRSHYSCLVPQAHYLARILVRPLEGKRMPTATLSIHVDGEEVLRGPLSEFLPDPEPIDCLRDLLEWKKPRNLFQAVALLDDEADHSKQIGVMMPSATPLEVRLSGIVAQENVSLEVEALSALYGIRKEEKP